ncbi:MAG: hypothetical protein EAX91_16390 [Candidatus Lokiarchaeota archaeon]|nr:hypothetical protein [Candidatus Lokiarchaeota archaeon]
MEDKELEEYKRRILELIENVEKSKDIPFGEQQVIDSRKKLLQIAKAGINPNYRREILIIVFTHTIRDYYKKRADPNETENFQEEIDELYRLIYEELRKPSPYIPDSDPKHQFEIADRRRILRRMTSVLGVENINQFKKDYKLKKLVGSTSILQPCFCIIFGVLSIILIPILYVVVFKGH